MNSNILKKIEDIKRKANLILSKINEAKKNKEDISKKDFKKAYKQLQEYDNIISENYKTINEQLMLIEELTNLKESIELAQYSEELTSTMDFDTYFDLTLKSEIEFNIHHPYYNNIRFIKKLIDTYIELEKYEKCSDLLKLL